MDRRGMAVAVVAAGCCALGVGCSHEVARRPPGVDQYIDGAIAFQKGDADHAVAALSEAVQKDPNLTMAHVMLGDIYKDRTDYHRAAQQYEAAVKLDPYEYKNHYDLGVTYQFLNRLQEAAAAYLRALKLQPLDLDSNMNLGLVYLALGQTDDAVKQMRKATQIAPHSAVAFCNLGVTLDARGAFTEAELAYRRSLELDPEQTLALVNLGNNLVRQNHGREAVAVLQVAVKKSDAAGTHKRYGDALVLTRRDDDALTQYVIALQQNPRYWQAMNQVGAILIRKYEAGMTLDERLRQRALDFWRRSLELRSDQRQIAQLISKYDQGGKVLP